MSADWDVAVVGAGPAGTSCALHLARGGARVALLEKRALPRAKVCGGGLVARARRQLPAGVELPVERSCRRVAVRLGARTLLVERDEPLIEMCMRADLDAALATAAARAGAELVDGCEVHGFERTPAGFALATSRGTYAARALVAADGVHSALARLAGWSEPVHAIGALEAEVASAPERSPAPLQDALFEFGSVPRGYAWSFPKRAQLSVGVLSVGRGRSLRAELARHLAAHGLQRARAEVSGWLIPARPRQRCARGGVLLAGDAAGLADPITFEGISLALWSGRLAAEALLAHADDPRAAGRAYERRLAREILPDLRLARALARLLYRRSGGTHALLARVARPLADGLVEVMAGRASYCAVLASTVPAVLLSRRTP
jgi:geranylgeranyl reductase family protein